MKPFSKLAPLLDRIGRLRRVGRPPVLVDDASGSLASATPIERALRASHQLAEELWPRFVGAERATIRSILVAAPQRSSGATSVAAASALRLSQHLREPIGLVELDLERPRLLTLLGGRAGMGTSECLLGQAELGASLQHLDEHPYLSVLAGGAPRRLLPGEFATPAFARLRDDIEHRCRTTVYIAPPLESCHDMRLVVGRVDGVVLVVRAGRTSKQELTDALAMLDESGARLVGTVLTGANSSVPFMSEAA